MSGLPPIDHSLLPPDVRKASEGDRKTYAAALGFERALVNELAKTMADTAKPGDGDESQSQDAASSMYLQMLPDQLSDAILQGGGLGLARDFYTSLKERGK